MAWFWVPIQVLGSSGLGGIILLVALIWVLEGLFRWAAEYWGAISLVLGSAAIIFVSIRSIINYKKNGASFFSNIKAHGSAFSILWLLGTLALLIAGYLVKELTVTGSQALKFNFGLVFCVIGIIAGALTGGKLGEDEGEGDDAGEGAMFGAFGFAILFVVFFIAIAIYGFMSNTGADDLNRALIGAFSFVIAPILGIIGGAIIGAVIGAILGAIGGAIGFGIGGKLIGGLLGIISGGGLGILLSVFFYSMLESFNGAIGAAGLTLAASFGLFNKFSPEDRDTLGEGRIAWLVTLLIAALSVGILSVSFNRVKPAADVAVEAVAPILPTAVVTANGLNLRSGPSTNSEALITLPKGTSLSVTGEARNGWLPVDYEGRQGFVSAELVSIEQ